MQAAAAPVDGVVRVSDEASFMAAGANVDEGVAGIVRAAAASAVGAYLAAAVVTFLTSMIVLPVCVCDTVNLSRVFVLIRVRLFVHLTYDSDFPGCVPGFFWI